MKRLRSVQDQYAHVCVCLCVCVCVCVCVLHCRYKDVSSYSNTQKSGNNDNNHIRISFMMSGTVIVCRYTQTLQ